MKILVTAATKHGSTEGIASAIAKVLCERRLDVAVVDPQDVRDLDGYDGIIVGSAVYAGHWLKPARTFIERFHAQLAGRPVWLFSSGPIGEPPKPEADQLDLRSIMKATNARDHRIFAGSLDKSTLSLAEKAITRVIRAPEGDYRDWDEITEWASGIAEELAPAPSRVESSSQPRGWGLGG